MDASSVFWRFASSLFDLALIRGCGRHQILVLQHSEEWPLLHRIAAVYQEPLHGRGNLRHHVPLIQRIQNAIGSHSAAHGILRHRRHLHRRRRFHFGFLFFGAAAGDDEARGTQQSDVFLHG